MQKNSLSALNDGKMHITIRISSAYMQTGSKLGTLDRYEIRIVHIVIIIIIIVTNVIHITRV